MGDKAKSARRPFATQTLERGLEVLAAIAASPIGLLPGEAARKLGISRPAAYRAIAGLSAHGFVARIAFSGRYVVAQGVVDLIAARKIDDKRMAALRAVMLKLCKGILWPVSVAGPAGLRMVVWATTDDETPLTLERFKSGFDVPLLESASGIAYLAHLGAPAQTALLNQLAASKEPFAALAKTRARCLALLRECKRRGYAMTTHDVVTRRVRRKANTQIQAGQNQAGQSQTGKTTSLSVPILVQGQPIACIAMRYFDSAMPRAKAAQRYHTALKDAAREIAQAWV